MFYNKVLPVVIGISFVSVTFLYHTQTHHGNVMLSPEKKKSNDFDSTITSMCAGHGVDDDMDTFLLKCKQITLSCLQKMLVQL